MLNQKIKQSCVDLFFSSLFNFCSNCECINVSWKKHLFGVFSFLQVAAFTVSAYASRICLCSIHKHAAKIYVFKYIGHTFLFAVFSHEMSQSISLVGNHIHALPQMSGLSTAAVKAQQIHWQKHLSISPLWHVI